MLIPNKYSGYQAGARIYPVGGGVGEAMLLGAAMSGGAAAVTGGDPLKGALIGGLTGGIGSGVGGALAGGAEAATASSLIPSGQSFAQASQAANAANAASQAAAAANAPTAALNASMANALPVSAQMGSSIPGMVQPLTAAPAGIPAALPATAPTVTSTAPAGGTFAEGMGRFASNPIASIKGNMGIAAASGLAGAVGSRPDVTMPGTEYDGPLKRFRFNPDTYRPAFAAQGGIMSLAEGGITALAGGGYDRMVGEQPMYQGLASGGISDLGTYSDGGRMLKGPGDGMSDSIPGVIGGKRPARLADGEFVVPADVVSHLGNGSTDAGAKQLYAMMDKVRSARTGTKKQGREINPRKYMPA